MTPKLEWKDPLTEREPHYLKGIVLVGGVEFHAEAWEVHDVTDTDEADGSTYTYQATLPGGNNTGDELLEFIVGGDAQPLSLNGKDYLFLISPYQR